jgi:uncharacterized protein (DUF433 family)
MTTPTMVCIAGLDVPTTQLDDYFDFQRSDDIRLKGTRVGIETILYDFIHRCRTPEEIVQSYPTLTLEQIYATILYYHRHTDAVSKYIADWLEYCRLAREEQERNPSPAIVRLRKIKAEREAARRVNESSVSNG